MPSNRIQSTALRHHSFIALHQNLVFTDKHNWLFLPDPVVLCAGSTQVHLVHLALAVASHSVPNCAALNQRFGSFTEMVRAPTASLSLTLLQGTRFVDYKSEFMLL